MESCFSFRVLIYGTSIQVNHHIGEFHIAVFPPGINNPHKLHDHMHATNAPMIPHEHPPGSLDNFGNK